jgi:hypothetical protein
MYRSLVMFPKAADQAEVDDLIERIGSSFKSSEGCEAVTRSDGALMGPGGQVGDVGCILEADFRTLDDAMAALDAKGFQEVAVRVEALTSSIFLYEITTV